MASSRKSDGKNVAPATRTFHLGECLAERDIPPGVLYKFKMFGPDAFTGAAFRVLDDDYDASNGFLYRTWIYGSVIGMGFHF